MRISKEGFIDFDELLAKLRERWPDLSKEDVRSVVENDPKGRYEIQGEKIRARYGHSIDVSPVLNQAKADELYHGTTQKAAKKILNEGLKSKGRQKVHLSKTIEDAKQVGKRRTDSPVILKVDAEKATESGIKIERASDRIYVSDNIPPNFISLK